MRVILAIMLLSFMASAYGISLTTTSGSMWTLTYGTSTTAAPLVYTLAYKQAAAYAQSVTAQTATYIGGACYYTTNSSNKSFSLNTSGAYNAFIWTLGCTTASGDTSCNTAAETTSYAMGKSTTAVWASNTSLTQTGWTACTTITSTYALSNDTLTVSASHTAACGPVHKTEWYGYCWYYALSTTTNQATGTHTYAGINAVSYSGSQLISAVSVASIAVVVSFF